MELVKGLDLAQKEFSLYLTFFIETFSKPKSFARPRQKKAELTSPEILYAAFSLAAGSVTLHVFAKELSAFQASLSVFLSIIWTLLTGSILHGFCLLLRGRGPYMKTLSITLRISSMIWLLSSLLAVAIVSPFQLAQTSVYPVCLVISGVLLIFYLPISLGECHGFKIAKRLIFALCFLLPFLTLTNVIVSSIANRTQNLLQLDHAIASEVFGSNRSRIGSDKEGPGRFYFCARYFCAGSPVDAHPAGHVTVLTVGST